MAMAGRGLRCGRGDLLPVLRAAAALSGVRQHQAGAQTGRAVADGGLHAQAAPVQNRRTFGDRKPLYARTPGEVVCGFLQDRDRGTRQRNPRRPRTWRHVRADRPRRTQVRIGTNVMIKVLRIGHATFETPDLAKAIEHYTQVIGLSLAGREDKRAFLATKIGQLAIELRHGAQARCAKLSFEVAANADFSDLRRELQKHGVAAEERTDSVPGVPKVLSFQDPKGTEIELFSEWSMIGNREQVVGAGVLKLGHVAFVTPEPMVLAKFYGEVLGFRIS